MKLCLRLAYLSSLAFAAASLTSANELDVSQVEIVSHLKDLVRIDTSNPPGNETQVANYVRDLLAKEGIAAEIFEKVKGRGNLVARLKGSGKQRPILLLAHSDVVGVERDKWTVDPFAAVEKDGFLYGRGVCDNKTGIATMLQVLLDLKRRTVPLDRDVILCIEAGEEASTDVGIDYLIAEHWDQIDAEFALNEGGRINADDTGRPLYMTVSTSEKVPHPVYLSVRGESGHASMPRPDNAIVHLSAAVAKLGQWQTPLRLNETTRAYFEKLAQISPPEKAWLYRHLEDAKVGAQVQEVLRVTDYALNSMCRTSLSPTTLKAGFRINVIPGDALASIDLRALPDEDIAAFTTEMRRIIADPAVEITFVAGNVRPGAPPSRLDSVMYRALERAQERVLPGLATLPEMPSFATDSAQLRAKGVQAYGVGDFLFPDNNRVHGNDERTWIAGLKPFFAIVRQAVVEVAATPEK